jgi:hypothetical protein
MTKMRKVCLCISILVLLSVFAVSGASAAKELQVSSATGTAGVEFFVTCNGSEQLDGYNLMITWDPAVMNVTAVTDYAGLGNFFYSPDVPVTSGCVYVQDFSGSKRISENKTLLSLTCNALVPDGNSTAININDTYSKYQILERGEDGMDHKVQNQYTLVPGKFTTADYTEPTITITNPSNGSTVSQTVNVAATITDVGGVNQSSIRVFVGGVEVTNPTIAPIVDGFSVTAQRDSVPLGSNVQVEVRAKDITGNSASVSHYVTVAEAGITFASPVNGTYTNEAQPAILANFVKVDCDTLKMFINDVDVTTSCTLTGSGPDGTIALDYSLYGALADGAYHVVVNGTSTLVSGQVECDEVYFVKDTVAPIVTITNITDSDGDKFPEAGEWLYVYYTAIDANLGDVWFDNGCNSTGEQNGFVVANISTGNKNVVACASDLAGNIGYSAPIHIYNNNLVYFDDPSLGSFAGLDLTKTALYDVFSTARAFTLTGPNAQMTTPTLGELNKTLVPGSNVTIDCRKNDPIRAGSLPSSIGIYTTPSGTLDFTVKVPNVTNATLMIARANSTLIDQLIKNPSKDALTPGMLKDLLDSKKIVLYGKEGYAIVNVDANTFESVGTIQVTPSNMPKTIRTNYVDLNAGFNTKNMPYGSTPLPISKLGQGEYALLAVCMDDDRFAIVAGTTFEVTNQAGLLSTSAGTYTIGQPVVVNSAQKGEVLSAVVLNSKATYTGNVTLDFSTLGKETFKSAYLLADGNQTVVKPYGKANVWLTKGYGNASAKKNTASVSVPTHDLLPGEYRVYMFLEDNGNVTSYNEAIITLTTVTPTPTPYTPGRSSGGGSGSSYTSYTGTGTLTINNVGTVLRSIKVNADDKVGSLLVPIGVKALDKDGKPLTSITLTPLASDKMPAVPSGALFKFAGYVYEAGPDGATFEPGITLAFDLPADAWNALDPDNNDFKVKWYNEETEEWEDVPTTTYKSTRSVDAEITHFSIFALFTEPVTTPTETPTPPVDIDIPTTPPVDEKPPAGEFPTTIFAIVVVLVIVIAAGYFFIVRK